MTQKTEEKVTVLFDSDNYDHLNDYTLMNDDIAEVNYDIQREIKRHLGRKKVARLVIKGKRHSPVYSDIGGEGLNVGYVFTHNTVDIEEVMIRSNNTNRIIVQMNEDDTISFITHDHDGYNDMKLHVVTHDVLRAFYQKNEHVSMLHYLDKYPIEPMKVSPNNR